MIALVIGRHCLGYTTHASYQLQGAEVDVLCGLQEIDSLMFFKTAHNGMMFTIVLGSDRHVILLPK